MQSYKNTVDSHEYEAVTAPHPKERGPVTFGAIESTAAGPGETDNFNVIVALDYGELRLFRKKTVGSVRGVHSVPTLIRAASSTIGLSNVKHDILSSPSRRDESR